MHSASSLLLSPLIAQYILYCCTIYCIQWRPTKRDHQQLQTLWHTHSQSINTFYKGEIYIKCYLCVFILNAFYLKWKLCYMASPTLTSTIPLHILKCHLHFSVPPIQLTRATHKTNNVCLQHFGLRRILHFGSILKYPILPSFLSLAQCVQYDSIRIQ